MPQVDDVFAEKWFGEAHIEFEQKGSKFKDKTKVRRGSKSKGHLTKFSNIEATIGKARHADVIITNQEAVDIPVTPTTIYASLMIDDWDQAKVDFEYRQVVNENIANAVWRSYDDLHVTAMGLTPNAEVVLPTANTMNYAGFVEMSEQMDLNDVPEEGRMSALSPGACTDLRNDGTYINNFHNQNSTVTTGQFKDVSGFDGFKTTRLANGAAGSTERRNLFWQKDAVVTSITKDFSINIGYVYEKQGWLFTASMLVGVAIFDSKGVFFADVTN